MYLVGARFDDLDSANAALGELRLRVAVEAGDLGLRPLGSLRYERPTRGLIVAGRFRIADVDDVVEIMGRHGGEIVFKRADWRSPRPRARGSAPGSERGSERGCARCQRLTRLRT